jgi:hypothetical protein
VQLFDLCAIVWGLSINSNGLKHALQSRRRSTLLKGTAKEDEQEQNENYDTLRHDLSRCQVFLRIGRCTQESVLRARIRNCNHETKDGRREENKRQELRSHRCHLLVGVLRLCELQ